MNTQGRDVPHVVVHSRSRDREEGLVIGNEVNFVIFIFVFYIETKKNTAITICKKLLQNTFVRTEKFLLKLKDFFVDLPTR